MKRNLLITIPLLFCCLFVNAQSWTAQNTLFPNESSGVDHISVPAPDVAWILAYDGAGMNRNFIDFSMTSDGGANWTPGTVGTDTNYKFSNISAVDGNTAYVCMFNNVSSSKGGIWKTTNGGSAWTRLDTTLFSGDSSFADFVHFWDADTGLAVGDPKGGRFEIYMTVNGGTTWTRTPLGNIPAHLSGEFGIIDYYDWFGNTIWFATNKGRVYKSVDRGLNWTVSTVLSLPNTQGMRVKFLDANNGLVAIINSTTGGFVSLRRTSDGGTTWSTQPVTGTFFTADYGRIPGSGLYMSTGSIFNVPNEKGSSYSADSGVSWTVIDTLQHTALGAYNLFNVWSGSFTIVDVSLNNLDGIFKFDPGTLSAVRELNLKADVTAYPNPGSGIVHLNFKLGRNVDVNVSLMNMLGAQVYHAKFSNVSVFTHTFDFTQLPKGVYMMSLEYNGTLTTQKVVIE